MKEFLYEWHLGIFTFRFVFLGVLSSALCHSPFFCAVPIEEGFVLLLQFVQEIRRYCSRRNCLSALGTTSRDNVTHGTESTAIVYGRSGMQLVFFSQRSCSDSVVEYSVQEMETDARSTSLTTRREDVRSTRCVSNELNGEGDLPSLYCA